MTYWTTSGQFVFVVLLSATGNVAAPLIGTFILEMIRIYAVEPSPNTWQMILGSIIPNKKSARYPRVFAN